MAGPRLPFPVPVGGPGLGPPVASADPLSALRGQSSFGGPAPTPQGADPFVPGGNLGRGVGSGFHGALANIQAYGAAMADSMGFTNFAKGAQESALRRSAYAQSMAPTVGSTDQIGGFYDAAKYAAGAIGGAAGSLAPVAAGGILGGMPGAFATMVPMSGGEVAMRHYQNKRAGDPAAQNVAPYEVLAHATGQGALQGALGLAPIASILGKGPLARIATRSAPGSPAQRFVNRAGTTALAEGAQEGGEELTAQLAMQSLYGQPAPLDMNAIRENAIAGAVGMAPFGVGHGIAGGMRDSAQAAKVQGLKAAAEARRLAEMGMGQVQEGMDAAKGSAPVANANTVVEAFQDNLTRQQEGEGANVNLGGKAAQVINAAKDTAPVAGAALKSAAASVTDSLTKTAGKAVDFLAPERRFRKSLDYLEKGLLSDDDADNSLPGRHQMVADALTRLGQLQDTLTPEEAAQVDQWVNTDSDINVRTNNAAIAQTLRRASERKQNRELKALFSTPLRGSKASLSPVTADQKRATQDPQWTWLEAAVRNVFSEPSERRGSEAPGAIGRPPLWPGQAKDIQRQATEATTGPTYTPYTPPPKGQKPRGRMSPEGDSALRIAHYFSDASDVDADQAIRGFRDYARRLAMGDDKALSVAKQVRVGLAQRFADVPNATAHLTGIIDSAIAVDDARRSGDEKAAKKALNGLLKSMKFTAQPAVKALARIGNMKPEEAQQYIDGFRAARDAFDSRSDPKRALEEQEMEAAIDRQFGERAAEARQLLYSQLPANHPLMDPNLKGLGDVAPPTVEGLQRARGDEFNAEKLDPDTLTEESLDDGPRVLSELGAFSRQAVAGSRDPNTRRPRSEMEASGLKLHAGEYATGPDARFRAMDVREAAEKEVGQDRWENRPIRTNQEQDPFSPEALAKVKEPKTYEEVLDKFLTDALNRHQQLADEARARLEEAGHQPDLILAEASAANLEPKELKELFADRLGVDKESNEVDDITHMFWTAVRQQHFKEFGAQRHAATFPYSVHAIRGKDELAADYNDERLSQAIVKDEEAERSNRKLKSKPEGPAQQELSLRPERVQLYGPTGEVFTLDVRKALELSLRDNENNFNPKNMRSAFAGLLEHLKYESSLVNGENPFPPATAKAFGLEGEMDEAFGKAVGIMDDSNKLTPEQAVQLLKPGIADKKLTSEGTVGGWKFNGRNYTINFPKAIKETAKHLGMDEEMIEKMDVENVAAVAKILMDTLKKAGVEFPMKRSEMKNVLFFTTDKGRPVLGVEMKEYADVVGDGVYEARLERDPGALTYRKTLNYFNSEVEKFDKKAAKAVEGIDGEIAQARGRLSKAQRAGEDTFNILRTIANLEKQRADTLMAAIDETAVKQYGKAEEGTYDLDDTMAAEYAPKETRLKRIIEIPETGARGPGLVNEPYEFTLDRGEEETPGRPAMKREAAVAKLRGLYETLNQFGGNLDITPESEAQDFSANVSTEGVRTEDPTGAEIDYARPGDLKAPKVKQTAEQLALSQVEDMLRTEATDDVLEAVKGYPTASLEYIRANLTKTPKTGKFLRGLEKQMGSKASMSPTGSGGIGDFGDSIVRNEFEAATAATLKKFGQDAPETGIRDDETQAGGYDPETPDGKAKAWISRFALNPFQAGAHEDLHHFFALMRKAGGEALRVIETLDRATRDEKLLNKARELLIKDATPEQAEALLKAFNTDPEERMAYLYQLRTAGLLDAFNPAAEGAIKKILKWIQKKIGYLTDSDKAHNVLTALDEGKLVGDLDNASAIARAMGQEGRIAATYRAVEKSVRPLAEAIGNVFTPSYERLLKIGNSGIDKIANAYGSMDTNDEGRMGLVHERERTVRLMENKFSEALGESTKAERDEAIQQIINGRAQNELATKIAAVLKTYTKDRVPLVLDRNRIEESREEFMQDVKITGPNDPGNVRRALWGDELETIMGGEPLPQFEFKSEAKRAKWQRQTAEEYLGGFIKQHAAKEARDAALGPKGEKLQEWLAEAKAAGMSDSDLGLVKQFIAGAEGWLGKDFNPTLRRLQGVLMTGLNVAHLPYSILSAMVDPIYIGARSGSMSEAWEAYSLGIKSIADTFLNKEGRLSGEAAKFGEDVGLIAQAGIAEPMGDFFSAMSLEGTSKKINNQFFRWNLLQGWERAMFAASAMAAQRFLLRHADGKDEFSAAYLKELGVEPGDITARPDGHLATFESDGLTPEQAKRIQNAIYKFSHQSAARPTSMSNPMWMNDPHFALIAHMKRFTMAQVAGILKWMETQGKNKNLYPLLVASMAVPIQLASGSMRNMITGGKSMPTDFMGALTQGASESGLMGRWHFGYDVANGAYNNLGLGIGVDQIAGPAWSDAMAVMRDLRGGKKD